MPLISIIVPIYNVEKHIRRCLDSIKNQTFRDFEAILIDDGSPDRCGEIADEYAVSDSRFIVIHQKNQGLSAARNTGLGISRGEYIGFVDSDDYVDIDMYNILFQRIEQDKSDLAICRIRKIDINGEIIVDSFQETDERKQFSGIEILEKYNYGAWMNAAWNKLYRKELFYDIRFPVGKTAEDVYIMHRILYECHKVSIVANELYSYVKRNNSITNSGIGICLAEVEAWYARLQFFEQMRLSELYDTTAYWCIDWFLQARNGLSSLSSAMKGQLSEAKKMARYCYKYNCNRSGIPMIVNVELPWLHSFLLSTKRLITNQMKKENK